MARLYDARGNRYLVVTPDEVVQAGVSMPETADAAARAAAQWTRQAIDAFCREGARGAKPFVSDGLLIGPFGSGPPFELLIVNTDGGLAERSGNGLTIFATCLRDCGLAPEGLFDLLVRHGAGAPLATTARLGEHQGRSGVWLSMGEPGFGPEAVGARPEASLPCELDGAPCSHVPALAAIDPRWRTSLFVRVGNPHCVTVLPSPAQLPTWDGLHAAAQFGRLKAIADPVRDDGSGGIVCQAGVNLQWAAVAGPGRIAARVFERGEGPTLSSGTSAVAVAAACLHLGLVRGPEVTVEMPGGSAPVIGLRDGARLKMSLFGVAEPVQAAK